MTEIATVAIIGAGVMGHGIAEVAAMSGQNVSLIGHSEGSLDRAKEQISASLSKLVEKGTLREKPHEVLRRIHFTLNLEQALRNADLVLEAVPEDIQLKSKILSDADKLAPAHAIFATNTSGLSINLLSEATGRPDRFVGMHWMNPPVRMRLIEIVKAANTSGQAMQGILDLCKRYDKEAVIAKRDVWFFLSARSQTGWPVEAALMVHGGRASVQDVDAMARYRLGLPMGPFEIADLTGAVDIRIQGLQSAKKILDKRPDFEPWPAFLAALEYVVEVFWKPMREKGLTGVKAGQGFYTYPAPGKYKRVNISQEAADRVNPIEVLVTVANTAAWCVTNGVGSVEDVEQCFKRAYNWPKGVFEFVRDYGPSSIIRELESKQKAAPESIKAFYEPDPLLLEWV